MADSTPAINTASHNVPEYSVSEISGAVKRMVEDRFGRVRVRGEISGFKAASSGHVYFSLKDDKAVLSAVCWRGTASKFTFKPEDGLEVVATGKITTYPGRSNYQIVVDFMEPAGAGALMAMLEKRKAELAKEGLFAPECKQPLPFLPRTIGVITSPTGAVIRDILHRLQERFPAHVIVWPVAVQGEKAEGEIAAAIRGFDALKPGGSVPRPDVLIVARGGGSIEDLWAFNEEAVVRAAAACSIPLISAVGHETDTTLIDYVSDRRAPTPTAAAEIAVPVREELLAYSAEQSARLTSALTRLLSTRTDRLEGLSRGLPRPDALLAHADQRLDDWSDRLKDSLPSSLIRKSEKLSHLATRLRPNLLSKEMQQTAHLLSEYHTRLKRNILQRIEQKEQQLTTQSKLLSTLDYKNVLKRGYALVQSEDGSVITTSASAQKQKRLKLTFSDGEIFTRSESAAES